MEFLEFKTFLKTVVKPKDSGSYTQIYEMLYHMRLLKYTTKHQILEVGDYDKYTGKFDDMVEVGILKSFNSQVYTVPDNIVKHLAFTGKLKSNYYIKLLPKSVEGMGDINQLNNTDVFIQALNLPDFKALLYPDFTYLKPDSLLVRAKDGCYKLEFLEVEASKTNWNEWLENKRINYLRLAKDQAVYDYWISVCGFLNIPPPNIKDFKFSVSIIGKIKKDFGTGFNFMERL